MFSSIRSVAALAVVLVALLLQAGCCKDEREIEAGRGTSREAAGTALDTGDVESEEKSTPDPDMEEYIVEELAYDDGEIDQRNSPWSEQSGGQLAVAFTPSSYPATIQKVSFFIGSSGVPTKTFRVRIYQGDLSTGPVEQDLLDTAVLAAAGYADQWVVLDLSAHGIMIPEGDFFVAMEWITPPGNYGTRAQKLGADTSGPDRRSWWKHYPDSDWVRIEEISDSGDRDLMIRATVLVGQ